MTNIQDAGAVTESLLSSSLDRGNSTAEDAKQLTNKSLNFDKALDNFTPTKKSNGMVCSVKRVIESLEEPTKSKFISLMANSAVLSLDLVKLLKEFDFGVSAEVMRRHRRRAKGGGCSCL